VPHFDRRPRSAERSEPAAQRVTRSSAPAQTAAAAPSAAPAPETRALETNFGLVPLAAGARVVLRTKYAVRATLVAGPDDGDSRQSVEVDAAERIVVTVVRAGDEGAREVDVEYAESRGTFRMEGTPDEEESNAGKRYSVVLDGAGARVTAKAGALEPDEDRGVLLDLATVTGYFPVLKPHLPRSIGPGFRLRLDGNDVARVFGAPPDVEFEGSELALRGRSQGDASVAVFECRLPVSFVKDGVKLRASLSGTASVRTADARPLDISLRGTLSSEADALGAGSSFTGSVSIELSHEYQDAK
jgi:hypothetical protein